CCRLAARMAKRLAAGAPLLAVVNEVVLNQVLVGFDPPAGDRDAFTRAVIARVQADGTCWLGGTRFMGREAMRISVSNWSTTEADIDLSAAAILRCARAEAAGAATSSAAAPPSSASPRRARGARNRRTAARRRAPRRRRS